MIVIEWCVGASAMVISVVGWVMMNGVMFYWVDYGCVLLVAWVCWVVSAVFSGSDVDVVSV